MPNLDPNAVIPALISRPTDPSIPSNTEDAFVTEGLRDKRFLLKGPSYCWSYPRNLSLLEPGPLAKTLIQEYLNTCSYDEHILLGSRQVYLRFLMYQDTPKSSPYVYGYLREIEDCREYDKGVLGQECPPNMIPAEINYATYGVFIFFDQKAWENRKVYERDLHFYD